MNTLKVIGTVVAGFVVLALLAFAFGFLNLGYSQFFGTRQASVQHEIFKDNKAYIEGAASDLAHYKYELSQEKDTNARKAILDLIVHDYGNLDPNKLENPDLRDFLQGVLNGDIK